MVKAMVTKLERVTVLGKDTAEHLPDREGVVVPDTPEPECLVEKRGHTLIVTLNRPHARNALSTEMMRIMVEAWDRIDADDDIRVAILTGAGGYFCAGADLKSMNQNAPGDSFDSGAFDPTHLPALLKGRRLSKPLIAAVEGPAIAGGTEILQGTDIRVAGEAHASASPRRDGDSSRSAGARCDSSVRSRTRSPPTSC